MSTVHSTPHPGQHKTFKVFSKDPDMVGMTIRIDDWWDRMTGGEFWLTPVTLPAASVYMHHRRIADLPMDEEIVYGWDSESRGFAVHVSELGPEVTLAGEAA